MPKRNWINRDRGVCWAAGMIIFLAFVARLLLADKNSYWLDELYSIFQYGSDNASASEMVRKLGTTSIHPPLYQIILYYWITVFGDSELATRTLSNLYVAGATLSVYLLAQDTLGRRSAIGVALLFSLMYMPIYYGLESRSYAQTLFLTSLSMFLAFRLLRLSFGHTKALNAVSLPFAGLIIVNTAILFTHYYNVFFLAAQGVFLLFATARLSTARTIAPNLAKLALIGAVPLALLAALWGPVMARAYNRSAYHDSYAASAEGLDHNAWTILREMVLDPNLGGNEWVAIAAAVALIAVSAAALVPIMRRPAMFLPGHYLKFSLFFWAILPCLFALALFHVASLERYSSRYFVFCVPPLAFLMVIVLRQAMILVSGFARQKMPLRRHFLFYSTAYVCLIAALLLPLAVRAAANKKDDWRGIAQRITDMTARDPGHSYFILETTYRDFRTMDYYFKRMSAHTRVNALIRKWEEKRGRFDFEKAGSQILQSDFLVVVLTQHSADEFPQALGILGGLFPIAFQQLDAEGRGFILYRTRSN